MVNLADLYGHLEADLSYVEQELLEQVKAVEPALEEAGTHLLSAGGKRLRPVFVLLSGHFGSYDVSRLGKVAVALELTHMATLVHDDVIDHADTRRGRPTVKSRFGDQMAMYTGDYIFAKALSILTDISDPRVHQIFSLAIERMTVGEIEQIRDLYSLDQSVSKYLKRIRRKTALLIQVSCTLGALTAGAPQQSVSALRRFGYSTGMAFQIIDDVLDFTSTEEQLGKPVGSDLRQGNITLPVLYSLGSKEAGERLRQLVRPDQKEDELEEAIAIVRKSGGVEYAQALAQRYLVKASEALAYLPATPARTSLAALATFVGKRDH